MEEFVEIQVVGTGSYGNVVKALWKDRNKIVAVKKMLLDGNDKIGIDPTTLRQISILKSLPAHQNISNLLHIFLTPQHKTCLIFDYYQSTLYQKIKNLSNVSYKTKQFWSKRWYKDIFRGILNGLELLHNKGIIHRDLKPQNILLNKEDMPKICDFGLSRFLKPNKLTLQVSTLRYKAPEVILGYESYDYKVSFINRDRYLECWLHICLNDNWQAAILEQMLDIVIVRYIQGKWNTKLIDMGRSYKASIFFQEVSSLQLWYWIKWISMAFSLQT